MVLILAHHLDNPIDLAAAEAAAVVQTNWVYPNLRAIILTLDVDMRWFSAIAGEKEEPIWPDSQYRRHAQ